MTFRTAVCGLALAIIGLSAYFLSEKEKPSPTALIPAGFGAVLMACAAIVAWKEGLRKHVMHLAALVGVIGFVGGFAPIIVKLSKGDAVSLEQPGVRNGVLMSVICLAFVFLCVKSFIDAKKARADRETHSF